MSLKDVLSLKLKIPDYQRIYCWPQKNVEQLLDDIFIPRNHKYHLGTLILQKKGDDYDIIDGQQRTTTLYLLLWNLVQEKIKDIELIYEVREDSKIFIQELKKEDFDFKAFDIKNKSQDVRARRYSCNTNNFTYK